MAPEEEVKQKKVSKEEFDINLNRIAIALAKRESLIKSWTASSSRKETPSKNLDVEDDLLFRSQPAYLGVGAPIPAHFFTSDANQDNKSLRAKFFPQKGLKASKARDADEKAASAKRAKREEDSDEEQGRSGLGRAKKLKSRPKDAPVVKQGVVEEGKLLWKESQAHESAQVKTATPEPEARTELESSKQQMATPSPEPVTKPAPKNQSSEASGDTASSFNNPMEDISMVDADLSDEADSTPAKPTQHHEMNPLERKRMKAREKKKRSKAKRKAARSVVE